MSIAKQVEDLRARAAIEKHATTALELRVRALELELAELKAATAAKAAKAAQATRKPKK